MFILYDGRAKSGDPSGAFALDTAVDEDEAREAGVTTWVGHDAVWYEHKSEDDPGTMRADLPPCGD